MYYYKVLGMFLGHVYALHSWGGCMFVSGSADKTARFWDLRASTAITVVPSSTGMYSVHIVYSLLNIIVIFMHRDHALFYLMMKSKSCE